MLFYDQEFLSELCSRSYKHKIVLRGIIFLHSIADHRVSATQSRNLQEVLTLCGSKITVAPQNVILVTTQWDRVKKNIGESREKQLKTEKWKELIMAGCQVERFHRTHESAWEIVKKITTTPLPPSIHLQEIQAEDRQPGRHFPRRLLALRELFPRRSKSTPPTGRT
jgi:hypothetical protein